MEVAFESPTQQYFEMISELRQKNMGANRKRKRGEDAKQAEEAEEWRSLELFGAHNGLVDCDSCFGSGLYPVLSLANHNCNPNAAIEFLEESNLGSMVAIRDIAPGEEITISYVPNGLQQEEDDEGEPPSRGRLLLELYFSQHEKNGISKEETESGVDGNKGSNAEQSRSQFKEIMKHEDTSTEDDDGQESDHDDDKEQLQCDDDDDDDEDDEDEDDDGDEEEEQQQDHDENGDEEDEELDLEGESWKERSDTLMSYGFTCTCDRCNEQKQVHGSLAQ